jgi:hypothetical protein
MVGVVYAATAMPAEARCYKYWYYPTPQKCGGIYFRANNHATMVASPRPSPIPPARDPDIPLPDMSADWGGMMDTELELALQRQKAIRQLTLQGN